MTTVVRDVPTRIMTTNNEKQELVRAAQAHDTPLSTFIREAALEKARANPAGKPDWASFFAREIHPDVANWEFEREQFEDRDPFSNLPSAPHEGKR
jgi:hypothetical protein